MDCLCILIPGVESICIGETIIEKHLFLTGHGFIIGEGDISSWLLHFDHIPGRLDWFCFGRYRAGRFGIRRLWLSGLGLGGFGLGLRRFVTSIIRFFWNGFSTFFYTRRCLNCFTFLIRNFTSNFIGSRFQNLYPPDVLNGFRCLWNSRFSSKLLRHSFRFINRNGLGSDFLLRHLILRFFSASCQDKTQHCGQDHCSNDSCHRFLHSRSTFAYDFIFIILYPKVKFNRFSVYHTNLLILTFCKLY